MKLNKYIYAKLEERQIRFLENEPVTEDDIDDWIADWYNDTFKELGKVLNILIQPRYRVMTLGFLKITYKIYLEQENHNNNKV